MTEIFSNWKTTLAGLAAVFASAGHLLHALSTGDTGPIATDLPAIMAGLGLVFAGDSK